MSGNVCSLFFEAAGRVPDAIALIDARERELFISFRELRERVEHFTGGLQQYGFAKGDRALLMLPMSPELYVAVLGILTAGGVAVFVDPWIGVRQIARLAAHARPDAFIGTPKSHLLRLLHGALRRIPLTVAPGKTLFAKFAMEEMRATSRSVDVEPEAQALITYTTGSSGAPKGVNRTHAILMAQHRAIRDEFPVTDEDVDVTTFPVFGLSNLASGIATVIPPVDLRRVAETDGARVAEVIRRHGATTATASPPFFDRLAERAGSMALRRIVTGGAPVTDEQLRAWRAAFPKSEIAVAYGSSEAEPVARMSDEERLSLKGRGFCVGKPVGSIQTQVIPITRAPVSAIKQVPAGEAGELIVHGAHVCREYDQNEEAFRANKIVDEQKRVWHRMGDTGYFDEAGRFWLVGRVHSTIRRDGVNVHPQLIEEQAQKLVPEVSRVAAVGIPDRQLGERVVLVLEVPRGQSLGDVVQRLEAVVVDDINLTSRALPVDPRHNSKIDYDRLREMIKRGELR